ncbi:2178_t:CDS:2, partial [Cetraspora pellucida]
ISIVVRFRRSFRVLVPPPLDDDLEVSREFSVPVSSGLLAYVMCEYFDIESECNAISRTAHPITNERKDNINDIVNIPA